MPPKDCLNVALPFCLMCLMPNCQGRSQMSLPLIAKPGFKPMQAAPGVTNSHSFQQLSGSNISFLHDVTNNSSKLLLNGGWQPIFFSVSFKVLRIDQTKSLTSQSLLRFSSSSWRQSFCPKPKKLLEVFFIQPKKIVGCFFGLSRKMGPRFFSKHGIWA